MSNAYRNYVAKIACPRMKPKSWKTPYTGPTYWPIFENRGPIDRSPADKPSKVLVMGSGDPTPIPYRYGPALAVIVNNYPYFIDCGEGWWRAMGKSVLSQGAVDLASVFALQNLKYMFPKDMRKLLKNSGVKQIVLIHVQNYNDPEHFDRLGVRDEMRAEGVENILLAEDGDLY